jgi:hypothetical protein
MAAVKKLGLGSTSIGNITNLKQSIFFFRYLWQDQVVCDKRGGRVRFARLPNDKYPYRYINKILGVDEKNRI